MSDEAQALPEQENLGDAGVWDDAQEDPNVYAPMDEAAVADDEAIPPKFRGKSVRDIIDMYHNLETDYGRKGQLLGEYEQRLAQFEAGNGDDGSADGDESEAELERLLPAAQTEYQRLLSLGLEDNEELQAQAWQFAQQQDAYLRQAIAQGVEAQLAPYASVMAPTVYGRDVQSVLSAFPVHGVSAEELADEIAQAGVPTQEWVHADPEQRALFIVTAAKQLAYEKFARGELSPAGTTPIAPAQSAPGVLGTAQGHGRAAKDPAFERKVGHLAETMGLSRSAAAEVLRSR